MRVNDFDRPVRFELCTRGLLSVVPEGDVGQPLKVVRGTVWLTVEGEPHDIVLEAGGTHLLAPGKRAVLQALSDVTLEVEARARLAAA